MLIYLDNSGCLARQWPLSKGLAHCTVVVNPVAVESKTTSIPVAFYERAEELRRRRSDLGFASATEVFKYLIREGLDRLEQETAKKEAAQQGRDWRDPHA